MPRLAPALVRYASRQNQHLASLLGQCRTLESANNELRWLKEHVAKEVAQWSDGTTPRKPPTLGRLVKRRARGEPLQYILGNQPFGDLEILCRRDVLIPRVETEMYTTAVVDALGKMQLLRGARENLYGRRSLRILDMCSGTGCIALLLHSLLRRQLALEAAQSTGKTTVNSDCDLQILGIDLSLRAIHLSQQNLKHNLGIGALHPRAKDEVSFHRGDVFALASCDSEIKTKLAALISPSLPMRGEEWDILISNPPYVSPEDYAVGGRTEKSVRNFESEMALVPLEISGSSHERADLFYPRLLRLAHRTGVNLVVMEIGDEEQARRVRQLVRATQWNTAGEMLVETWYDDGTVSMHGMEEDTPRRGLDYTLKTCARAVVVWRRGWARRRTLMKFNNSMQKSA